MADDGMLLNFSIGEDVIHTKPVFRGGRWKERLTARRAAERRGPKPRNLQPSTAGVATAAAPEEDGRPASERPLKRLKPNSHTRNPTTPKEVVSSIFSFNPSSTSQPSKSQPEDDSTTIPSNAPLPSELNNFTTLGLSPTISTHLLTKLSLKAPTAIQKSAITQLLKEDSDAFIQAETGSGKTLAYLLPIVQRMMSLSLTGEKEKKRINRDTGLFAVILAPTRELCKQISIVLESLLRCANWIVAGTVIGGEKKKSEKARLRKGLNILVATPGRLVDHLDNTEVLDVSSVKWLVLDEGDRLVELGFEEDVKKIVQEIEKKTLPQHDEKEEKVLGLPPRRTTVLCSATMKMNVQRLGEISLKDAIHIKAELSDEDEPAKEQKNGVNEAAFLAPAQLKQSYIIVPPKQRLVTLAAFLKRTFARKGSVMKAIVFLSCADSVDFHFEVFARKPTAPITNTSRTTTKKPLNENEKENINVLNPTGMNPTSSTLAKATSTSAAKIPPSLPTVSVTPLLASTPNPHLTLHKLHGSLPQATRTATLSAFAHPPHPSILLCTDVASRGLDLPNIDLIIEYDPPFSRDDHLHRIGRTARAGREGRAVIFLMPGPEEGYVDILRQGYRDGIGRGLIRNEAEEVLRKGFGNAEAALAADQASVQGGSWSERAEQWQLETERWVVEEDGKAGAMAKRAFVSHVRAYATHVAKERAMFDVKGLHLGHLAKTFALRERPGQFGRGEKAGATRGRQRGEKESRERDAHARSGAKVEKRDLEVSNVDGQDAARKMRSKMREHLAGANEFNIG
ncbi:MAG: hypothetical protein Q9208_000033 [Pyrenodesmia sp. 3 TL-2023]